MNAIELTTVEKRFGKKSVLRGLDMRVPEGSVYALLGCNGVGKSTTVKLCMGQLTADAGTIRVLGGDPVADGVALRRKIGYVAENQRLFDELRLDEYCGFLQKFYPDWNAGVCAALTERFRLPWRGRLGTFSRGMYSKAALLGALCRTPKLLILDDPTLGLDTVARREFMDTVLETLAEFEHTVVISSHLIPELEGVCDHAGILRDGQMAVELPLEQLKSEVRLARFRGMPGGAAPGELGRRERLGEMELCFRGDESAAAEFLRRNGIADFAFSPLSLEEIFLVYAGEF